jgi:hypothetical protein
MSQESQVEGCEYQDDSDIHYQPRPESVSEEYEIHSDYYGRHRDPVNSHLSVHLSSCFNRKSKSGARANSRREPRCVALDIDEWRYEQISVGFFMPAAHSLISLHGNGH